MKYVMAALKYISAILLGAVLAAINYFIFDFTYVTWKSFEADPTNVGLFIGVLMTLSLSVSMFVASICLIYCTLDSDDF